MLARAPRRRDALRYLQQASQQIQLPWLCPALYKPPQTPGRSRSITDRSLKKPLSSSKLRSRSPCRSASAAASAALPKLDDYVPYKPQNYPPSSESYHRHGFSELSPVDPNSVILLDPVITERVDRHSKSTSNRGYHRGMPEDIRTTMEACLQVQRFDRALALLRQLQTVSNPKSPDLRDAFNDCLQAMVMDMIVNGNRANAETINRWVEVTMHNAGVEPDARTYALKVKAALVSLAGDQCERTVRRYWELARQSENLNELASLREILSDQDLGKLSEIVPNISLPEMEEDYHASEDLIQLVETPMLARRTGDEILENQQKGLGLSSLRKSLSLFTDDSKGEGIEDIHARQVRLETDAVQAAIERWRAEHEKMLKMGINGNLQGPKLGALLWQWHQKVVEKIREELKLVDETEDKRGNTDEAARRCEYGPFLRLLPPDHLAALVTIDIIGSIEKNPGSASRKLAHLVVSVGQRVEAEVRAEQARASARDSTRPSGIGRVSTASNSPSTRTISRLRGHSKRPWPNTRPRRVPYEWSRTIQTRIGAVLCGYLFDAARITVSKEDPVTKKMLHISQPVFAHSIVFQAGKRAGVVSMHPWLVEKLMREPPGDVLVKHLPMTCEPRPWTGFASGGFLESESLFLRVKAGERSQREYAEAAAERGDLDQIFAAVDVLGKTAWKINRDVFTVMVKAWNSGEAVGNLPPLNKVFAVPEKPIETEDRAARAKWFTAMRLIANEKQSLHSVRCFQNFQLEIAKAYLNETFYLPHNIDFRGRAYPIPPYLNQMGADNCRGLLIFAKGKELGEEGLRWLKIQLANVFGYDKASLADRENFPMEHLAEIRDSVANPLNGNRWWLTAEDPWQCLAACFELTSALELPDPTKHVSYLPVHQDGSCNGLQHYAALGGDIVGAKQVNLEPGDRPADVYTGVAELVKAEIHQEAEQGLEMAKLLDGRVTRKCVKQTVMTNVYGVTFGGAIAQVKRQVEAIMPELKTGTVPKSGVAAAYIARKIFKALGSMFSGAHDIQYWLGDCASRISTSLSPLQIQQMLDRHEMKSSIDQPRAKSLVRGLGKSKQGKRSLEIAPFRSSVIWTSPMRLPVVQPYRTTETMCVKTNIQAITIAQPTAADAVNKRKQLQAFPPNFIHSLDATHMLLSALKCHEVGMTFSAVHDSFWTHAADVNTLNRLLRDAFIRMHSEDIIGRLAAEFRARYKGHIYLASVNSETVLGKKIKALRDKMIAKDPTTKSNTARKYAELILESKRLRLLASDDLAKRTEGKAMVTPGSLYESLNGAQYLHTRGPLDQTAIGAVPAPKDLKILTENLQSEEVATDIDLERTLEPFFEADDADVEDAEETKPKAGARKGKKDSDRYWIWLPLDFRSVPRKGAFDVARLRDSKYFFS